MTARQRWTLQCDNCLKMCEVPPQGTVEEIRVQANAYHDWERRTIDGLPRDLCRQCLKLPRFKT